MAVEKERKLPEVLELDFVICDNTVNRYKWRLLVEGIDLEGFLKNPVCCVQHNTWMIPVGKWKNLRVESEELKGTVEFDRHDPEAVKLYWKYKDGYMSAVSLNIIPIEESEDTALLLPGQVYKTVTKSEMLEISLVTIPGQRNAVKLSTPEGKEYQLHLVTTNQNKKSMTEEEKQKQEQENVKLRKQLSVELVARHIGRGVISESEKFYYERQAELDYDGTKAFLDAKKSENKTTGNQELANQLVELHFKRGAIKADEKPFYENAAKLDYDGTKKVLEGKTGIDNAQQFVGGMQNQPEVDKNDRTKWTYLDYYKNDLSALEAMEKREPEKYNKLLQAYNDECKAKKLAIE